MSGHFFISYSSVDADTFALKLADDLLAGPPSIPVWVDKRHLRPGEDWDEQIVEAIRTCSGLIFVMSPDSVAPTSVCKDEWVRALRYKKPIIPLRLHPDAETPFRLGSREYTDFTRSFDTGLARLRKHLVWMGSPEGALQALKHRLADARRDLPRAEAEQRTRIADDIAELERQIAQQQAILADPRAAEQRVQDTIDRGLERVRTPAEAVPEARAKFINQPPLVAPAWFQNRHVETQMIGAFLADESLRLMTVVGRGGIGKSAMVCRLLRSLEGGRLPDEGGPLSVDGIVYLSDARALNRVSVPDMYEGLTRLLAADVRTRLDSVYKNPQANTRETMQALLAAFPRGRTVVLLDNFENEIDQETGRIRSGELDEALRAVLELPPHGLKVIVTTRVAPRELALVEPSRQRRLDLDAGLESPYAENILRAMDADGKVGLKRAPDALLAEARERTRGYPRALEHLFGILSADRDTPLEEILARTKQVLPDQVMAVLVGEAFSRLDAAAQRVMQALAIYRYPVPASAVDYLLQPHVPGIDSAPVLSRLVNMQFARRDAGRYYLHQIDRDYAERRLPSGEPSDRERGAPTFSRYALQHRAAEWFHLARTPPETWRSLSDLAPQLAEFELRVAGEDHDAAAAVLNEIDYRYLQQWGNYGLALDLGDRLEGHIANPALRMLSLINRGTALHRIGQLGKAIDVDERALQLSRSLGDRANEGTCLMNLGVSRAELGQSDAAIEHYEQARAIFRELGDRDSEAACLSNLANQFADRGWTTRAIEYGQHALTIHRETKDRASESIVLTNLGQRFENLDRFDEARQCFDDALRIARDASFRLIEAAALNGLADLQRERGDWEASIRTYQLAVDVADDSGIVQLQQASRRGLALTFLLRGDLTATRGMAEAARKYDYALKNHHVSLLLGIAALRLGDASAAREAFLAACAQAGEMLARNAQYLDAADALAIAQSGLALCDAPGRVADATQAFQRARAINADTGTRRRVLQVFDALAQSDTAGILTAVRAAAAGHGAVT